MPLGKTLDELIEDDVRNDPEFTKALMGEVFNLIRDGEVSAARATLRNIVHASIGFPQLSIQTGIGEKSLHRMLGPKGNPTLNNLGAIAAALNAFLPAVAPAAPKRRGRKPATSPLLQ